ncbi:MAG: hypothetical protein AABZ08_10775 [Planctomycetota bacterium]
MSPTRLAFIGAAKDTSPWLFQAITRTARFEALCGNDADLDAARIHARWPFTDLTKMLDEAEPDGVIITGPVARRAALAKQCLSAGVGVLVVGYPGSSRDLTRIQTLAQLASRPALVASPSRYSPTVLLARRLIESGKLGRPISMQIASTWRRSSNDSALIHADQVFEAVDLVRLLLGPLARIHGVMHGDGVMLAVGVTSDHVPVSLAFHSGGPVESLGIDWEVRAADGTHLRVTRDCRLTCGNGSRTDAAHTPSLTASDPVIELGYDALLKSFIHYLTSDHCTGLIGTGDDTVLATEALLRPGKPRPLRRYLRTDPLMAPNRPSHSLS